MNETVSERAVNASSVHRQDMRAMELGIGGTSFYEALANAMDELPVVIENTKQGARGKYAPLDMLMRAVKPTLLSNRILIRQGQERSHGADDGGTKTRIYPVYTDLIHWPTGQMHRTTIDVPAPKMDAQGIGSAITYGKRYSLLAALGLAAADDVTDDDGQTGRKREITDAIHESTALATLKAAIDKITDVEKLKSFKLGEVGQKLEDGELGMLQLHWQAAAERLKVSS